MGSGCTACSKRRNANVENKDKRVHNRRIEKIKKAPTESIFTSMKTHLDGSKKYNEANSLEEFAHNERFNGRMMKNANREISRRQSQFIAVVHKDNSPKNVGLSNTIKQRKSGVLLEFQAKTISGDSPVPDVLKLAGSTNKLPSLPPLLSFSKKKDLTQQAQHSNHSVPIDEGSETGSGLFSGNILYESTCRPQPRKVLEIKRGNTQKIHENQIGELPLQPAPFAAAVNIFERRRSQINQLGTLFPESSSQFAIKNQELTLEQESLAEQLCSSNYHYKKAYDSDVSKTDDNKKNIKESQYKKVVRKNLLKTLTKKEEDVSKKLNPPQSSNHHQAHIPSRSSSVVSFERLDLIAAPQNVPSSDAFSPHIGFAPSFFNPSKDKTNSYSSYMATRGKDTFNRRQALETTVNS